MSAKLLNSFRISDENLSADPEITGAYDKYSSARDDFADARKALNDAKKHLHDLLDSPLRLAKLIQEGQDWTLQEDPDDGLSIQVWSEPKQRGRKKPSVPFQQVPLSKPTPTVLLQRSSGQHEGLTRLEKVAK